MTEDEMVGQHHRLNGHKFEQTLEDRIVKTGKFGMLKSMGSQIVRHNRATEQKASISIHPFSILALKIGSSV